MQWLIKENVAQYETCWIELDVNFIAFVKYEEKSNMHQCFVCLSVKAFNEIISMFHLILINQTRTWQCKFRSQMVVGHGLWKRDRQVSVWVRSDTNENWRLFKRDFVMLGRFVFSKEIWDKVGIKFE